jgi:hypothetical protein
VAVAAERQGWPADVQLRRRGHRGGGGAG